MNTNKSKENTVIYSKKSKPTKMNKPKEKEGFMTIDEINISKYSNNDYFESERSVSALATDCRNSRAINFHAANKKKKESNNFLLGRKTHKKEDLTNLHHKTRYHNDLIDKDEYNFILSNFSDELFELNKNNIKNFISNSENDKTNISKEKLLINQSKETINKLGKFDDIKDKNDAEKKNNCDHKKNNYKENDIECLIDLTSKEDASFNEKNEDVTDINNSKNPKKNKLNSYDFNMINVIEKDVFNLPNPPESNSYDCEHILNNRSPQNDNIFQEENQYYELNDLNKIKVNLIEENDQNFLNNKITKEPNNSKNNNKSEIESNNSLIRKNLSTSQNNFQKGFLKIEQTKGFLKPKLCDEKSKKQKMKSFFNQNFLIIYKNFFDYVKLENNKPCKMIENILLNNQDFNIELNKNFYEIMRKKFQEFCNFSEDSKNNHSLENKLKSTNVSHCNIKNSFFEYLLKNIYDFHNFDISHSKLFDAFESIHQKFDHICDENKIYKLNPSETKTNNIKSYFNKSNTKSNNFIFNLKDKSKIKKLKKIKSLGHKEIVSKKEQISDEVLINEKFEVEDDEKIQELILYKKFTLENNILCLNESNFEDKKISESYNVDEKSSSEEESDLFDNSRSENDNDNTKFVEKDFCFSILNWRNLKRRKIHNRNLQNFLDDDNKRKIEINQKHNKSTYSNKNNQIDLKKEISYKMKQIPDEDEEENEEDKLELLELFGDSEGDINENPRKSIQDEDSIIAIDDQFSKKQDDLKETFVNNDKGISNEQIILNEAYNENYNQRIQDYVYNNHYEEEIFKNNNQDNKMKESDCFTTSQKEFTARNRGKNHHPFLNNKNEDLIKTEIHSNEIITILISTDTEDKNELKKGDMLLETFNKDAILFQENKNSESFLDPQNLEVKNLDNSKENIDFQIDIDESISEINNDIEFENLTEKPEKLNVSERQGIPLLNHEEENNEFNDDIKEKEEIYLIFSSSPKGGKVGTNNDFSSNALDILEKENFYESKVKKDDLNPTNNILEDKKKEKLTYKNLLIKKLCCSLNKNTFDLKLFRDNDILKSLIYIANRRMSNKGNGKDELDSILLNLKNNIDKFELNNIKIEVNKDYKQTIEDEFSGYLNIGDSLEETQKNFYNFVNFMENKSLEDNFSLINYNNNFKNSLRLNKCYFQKREISHKENKNDNVIHNFFSYNNKKDFRPVIEENENIDNNKKVDLKDLKNGRNVFEFIFKGSNEDEKKKYLETENKQIYDSNLSDEKIKIFLSNINDPSFLTNLMEEKVKISINSYLDIMKIIYCMRNIKNPNSYSIFFKNFNFDNIKRNKDEIYQFINQIRSFANKTKKNFNGKFAGLESSNNDDNMMKKPKKSEKYKKSKNFQKSSDSNFDNLEINTDITNNQKEKVNKTYKASDLKSGEKKQKKSQDKQQLFVENNKFSINENSFSNAVDEGLNFNINLNGSSNSDSNLNNNSNKNVIKQNKYFQAITGKLDDDISAINSGNEPISFKISEKTNNQFYKTLLNFNQQKEENKTTTNYFGVNLESKEGKKKSKRKYKTKKSLIQIQMEDGLDKNERNENILKNSDVLDNFNNCNVKKRFNDLNNNKSKQENFYNYDKVYQNDETIYNINNKDDSKERRKKNYKSRKNLEDQIVYNLDDKMTNINENSIENFNNQDNSYRLNCQNGLFNHIGSSELCIQSKTIIKINTEKLNKIIEEKNNEPGNKSDKKDNRKKKKNSYIESEFLSNGHKKYLKNEENLENDNKIDIDENDNQQKIKNMKMNFLNEEDDFSENENNIKINFNSNKKEIKDLNNQNNLNLIQNNKILNNKPCLNEEKFGKFTNKDENKGNKNSFFFKGKNPLNPLKTCDNIFNESIANNIKFNNFKDKNFSKTNFSYLGFSESFKADLSKLQNSEKKKGNSSETIYQILKNTKFADKIKVSSVLNNEDKSNIEKNKNELNSYPSIIKFKKEDNNFDSIFNNSTTSKKSNLIFSSEKLKKTLSNPQRTILANNSDNQPFKKDIKNPEIINISDEESEKNLNNKISDHKLSDVRVANTQNNLQNMNFNVNFNFNLNVNVGKKQSNMKEKNLKRENTKLYKKSNNSVSTSHNTINTTKIPNNLSEKTKTSNPEINNYITNNVTNNFLITPNELNSSNKKGIYNRISNSNNLNFSDMFRLHRQKPSICQNISTSENTEKTFSDILLLGLKRNKTNEPSEFNRNKINKFDNKGPLTLEKNNQFSNLNLKKDIPLSNTINAFSQKNSILNPSSLKISNDSIISNDKINSIIGRGELTEKININNNTKSILDTKNIISHKVNNMTQIDSLNVCNNFDLKLNEFEKNSTAFIFSKFTNTNDNSISDKRFMDKKRFSQKNNLKKTRELEEENCTVTDSFSSDIDNIEGKEMNNIKDETKDLKKEDYKKTFHSEFNRFDQANHNIEFFDLNSKSILKNMNSKEDNHIQNLSNFINLNHKQNDVNSNKIDQLNSSMFLKNTAGISTSKIFENSKDRPINRQNDIYASFNKNIADKKNRLIFNNFDSFNENISKSLNKFHSNQINNVVNSNQDFNENKFDFTKNMNKEFNSKIINKISEIDKSYSKNIKNTNINISNKSGIFPTNNINLNKIVSSNKSNSDNKFENNSHVSKFKNCLNLYPNRSNFVNYSDNLSKTYNKNQNLEIKINKDKVFVHDDHNFDALNHRRISKREIDKDFPKINAYDVEDFFQK